MKVVLLQPPIEDFYDTAIRTYPLGLCYVAAAIQDLTEVEIIDGRRSKRAHSLSSHPFPELDEYYKTGQYSPFSLFSQYYRFGRSREEVVRSILEARPDILGISMLFSAYVEEALALAAKVREARPEIVIVAGGLHPTLFPEHVLNHSAIDYVIRGEGEGPMRQFVMAWTARDTEAIKGIKGLCFNRDGRTVSSGIATEDTIDLLPAHKFLSPDHYRMFGRPYSFLLTSRGCPLNCSFCGKPPVPFRNRSLSSIAEELTLLEQRKIQIIDVEDDMMNFEQSRFHDLLDLFARFPFEYYAMNGIYPFHFDARVIGKMEQAGFRKVNLSLVSQSRQVLISQSRMASEAMVQILPILSSSLLLTEVHFIIGLPGQSVGSVLETICFLMEQKVLLGPSIYYPVPGSRYWEEAELGYSMCRSSVMYPANFSRLTTLTLMKIVRFINYGKRILDKAGQDLTMSGLMKAPELFPSALDHELFTLFLKRHRFYHQDKSRGVIGEDVQEPDLIEDFFRAGRGKRICGFKTTNSLLIEAVD